MQLTTFWIDSELTLRNRGKKKCKERRKKSRKTISDQLTRRLQKEAYLEE